MSKSDYEVKILGINQLRKRLDIAKLGAKPLRTYYNSTGMVVVKEAKKHVPEDTGKLKDSITYNPVMQRGRLPAGIRIKADAKYASYVHGYMHENFRQSKPWSRSKPHFPPVQALVGWSRRKGLNPYLVALSIAKKGTPIVPFLKIGYNKTRAKRRALLAITSKDIERQWKQSRKKLITK
jgi:hypothetical protein|tara:strand:- start:5083 stop:5622 length:540 start_codon:yes stop_codon:yes gene_type:complete